MSKEKYFKIYINEDGDIRINEYSKVELLELINECVEDGDDIEYKKTINDNDPMYWGRSCLIIKGEIIIPEVKEVIKEYDIQ